MLSYKECKMNKSNTPTSQKIMIPLRLPPELYKKMVEEVQSRKKEMRSYSVNEYLTDLLETDLKEKEE